MASRSLKADLASEHSLPGSYALHVLELASRWGVTSDALLEGLKIELPDLEAPQSRVPVPTMSVLIRRARMLTREPGLGIFFGLQTRATTYGYLSFAAMCASSLGECVDLVVRYAPFITTAYALRLNRTGGLAALVVEEHCDLGDARDVILLGLLVGLRTVGCLLTGREPWRPIDVVIPEPPYYKRLAHLVPELRFSQPINQIALLESDLELPFLTPDRAALRLAVEQCERSMRALGLSAGIDQQVFDLILQDDGPVPFDKVASALRLSPRTLKRRLRDSGVTFSDLLEKARRERALLLLRSPDLSLDDVAERLGYSTVSNLVRAFRRWTGITPAVYRRGASRRLSVHLPLRR